MRTLSGGEATALSATTLPIVILVEMDFTSPLYLCTAGIDLTVAGNTYLGTRGLGQIDAVQDSPAEIKPLSFRMSGVPSAQISLALTEPVQGKAVRIKSLMLDPSTYQPFTPRLRWQGRGDVLAITDGPDTATLTFTAEHGAIDLLRGSPSYWSDSEQRRLFSSDPSLQYLVDQVEQRAVWPAASFFRK
jgi:hypothetical protein